MTAAVLVIGNEILSGRTRDANLQILAEALAERGIRLREARVVEDRFDAIVHGLNALRASHDFVFTTGGIGPTHDDITTECVAAALGYHVGENPEAVRRLTVYYPAGALNEARLKMARVLTGAALLDNPVTAAPGFHIENVFVLPGVPKILQAMLPAVLSRLPRGPAIVSHALTAWVRESEIAMALASIQDCHPGVDIGSYPFTRDGRLGTSLVMRSADADAVVAAADAVEALLVAIGTAFTRGEPGDRAQLARPVPGDGYPPE
jgi:molybdenum cofactor synthesis domain-containing protein